MTPRDMSSLKKHQANLHHQTRKKVISGGREGSEKSQTFFPWCFSTSYLYLWSLLPIEWNEYTGLGQAYWGVDQYDIYKWFPSLQSGYYVGLLCGIAVQGRVSIHYAVHLLLLVVALVVYHHSILLQWGVHPSAKGVHPVCPFDGHFSFQLAVCK